eukprot:XP_003729844.1 PREDICTED: uncharacterized protein LOC100892440 [Strongylocentrotus purpuratus]
MDPAENLKSSNSSKVYAEDQSSPQNGKLSTSPRQDSTMPTPQIMGPSGKKRLSPTCTTNRSNNNNMHSLNVDIDLANAKMNSVSPGRQCLSDSRLTVKPSKNIPASNHRKRKIDIDGAEIFNDVTVPMTSPKKKKLSPKDICNMNNVRSNKDLLTVDWNQNEKNVGDESFGKRRSSWSEMSPDSYKHSHNIGHRKVSPRVSPKMSNSSELPAPIAWKALPNSKAQNNHKDTHNVDRQANSVSPSSAKVQQNGRLQSSTASNGEQKRPSFSHSISNDSVFDDNVLEPNEIDEERFEKVDSEVAFNRTAGIKNNAAAGDMGKPKQATGRTSPRGGGKPKEVIRKHTLGSGDSGVDSKRKRKGSVSESVGSESVMSSCTEDSFTDDGSMAGREGLSSPEDGKPKKRRFKFADTLPPRAPRVRRVASLTAETKVHMLYERDEFIEKMPAKVSAPKKAKTSPSVSNAQGDGLLSSESISTDIKVSQDAIKVGNDSKGKLITGECMNMTNGQEKAKESKKPAMKARLKDVTSPSSCAPQLATGTTSVQTCTRCGKPMKPQGNIAPDEPSSGDSNNLKPDCSSTCNNKSINPSSTTLSPTLTEQTLVPHSAGNQMQLTCSCPQAQRSISEPAAGDNSLLNALAPLLGQPRRASVDAAECEKLNASLKGAFLLRFTRHSIDAPTAIASQLSLPLTQLGILQSGNLHASNGTPNNCTLATVPQSNGTSGTTITEFITSKSKVVRKVVKRPGLKPFHRRKSTNGWRGEGNPTQKPVIINNESIQEVRYCYESIRRKDDVIKARDCVLLRADLRKRDLPFVAKVAALYEDPDTGDLMMSLLWYYRPEHTEAGRLKTHLENEIFACRHWDINSVACIEDKCYVVTLAEYNRFYSKLKMTMEGIRPGRSYFPEPLENYPRKDAIPPPGFDPDAVFLCRQVYDFRQRRVIKNPY